MNVVLLALGLSGFAIGFTAAADDKAAFHHLIDKTGERPRIVTDIL